MKFPISSQLANDLLDKVSGFRKAKLEKLIEECNNLTSTNCGWNVYKLRNALKNFAQIRLDYLRCKNEQKGAKEANTQAPDELFKRMG